VSSAAVWAEPVPLDSPGALEAPLKAARTLAAPGAHGHATSPQGPPVCAASVPLRPEPPHADVAAHLTPREHAVMDRASHGRSNLEIGRDLNLALTQVKGALARSFAKLGVSDRAELVAAGFVRGLLTPRPMAELPSIPPYLAPLLPLIALGLTDEAIAVARSSTAPAVRNRMRELRRVSGARSREHAVRLAVEAGLLVVSPDGTRLALADPATGGAP
jgi:DNA-binding NarL/FixJ family response regulator